MDAIKELLYKMADDALILGHRNSEWNGLGPILEEDLAFSSMAQDKIGHAFSLYNILHEKFGEKDPDQLAFFRKAAAFQCCHFVELPIGEYDFSLIRLFLFDHAAILRFEMLINSSCEPLANLAKKIKGELKYHVLHADTWVNQLGKANEESHARMQNSLNECFSYSLGIFEPSDSEGQLAKENIFEGEKVLQDKWLEAITPILEDAGLKLSHVEQSKVAYGGRKGQHTEHLSPLLEEMGEVLRIDPSASW